MYRLFVGLLIVASSLQMLFANDRDIRVIKSDNSGLTVEYIPTIQFHKSVKINGIQYDILNVDGAEPISHQLQGEPELYSRYITVRLPEVSGNSVELLNVEYEDMQGILLQPVPSFKVSESGPVPEYTMNGDAYKVNSFFPDSLAKLLNIGVTRGAVLGNLALSPFQYNPATKVLRKISRIVVRVSFGTNDMAFSSSDDMLNEVAINNELFTSNQKFTASSNTTIPRHSSVLATGKWYNFQISQDGIYKITGATLLASGVSASTNPMNIKLYNNGGIELPASVTAAYPDDLMEVAVSTFDMGDNQQLDADDYILVYGKGVRGWNYTHATRTFSHYINHFTESNVYWLTVASSTSKQMSQLQFSNQIPQIQPETVVGKLYRDDDKINVVNSGLEWLGQQFNSSEGFTYIHSLPGLDTSQAITYNFRVGAQAKGYSNFSIYEHTDNILNTPSISPTDIDHFGLYFVGTYPPVLTLNRVPNFTDEQSRLRFVFGSSDPNGYGFLDWYEVFYRQKPRAQNDAFVFNTHDTTAVTRYSIPGFAANQVYVFDVSRFDSVLVNSQPVLSVDTCSFTLQLQSGSADELFVVGKNSFKSITQLTPVANQDIHGDTTEADEIIITNSEFLPSALRLKEYREQAGLESLRILIVDINKIYNEFGAGMPSPRAVRNYLKYVSQTWSVRPKYLLFIGDGDFDYRNILSQRTNKIPVWETGTEFDPIYSYVTDDDFVIFDNSLRVSMGVGRIPARSLQDANAAVDKIIEYETRPVFDPWKMNVTLLADDGWAGSDANDGLDHADNIKTLSGYIPKLFQTKKIFLHEYATEYTANGRRKPAVNEALRNRINSGTLMLNFAGHGNPRLWTHEQVFVRETDFPLLTNKGRYFFLIAATCNYSAMDLLNEQSSAEVLTLLPNAGAIATYCATRPVYSYRNISLNVALYQKMFAKNTAGQVIPKRLGDIVYQTRQNFSDVNDRKYVLLGDPAVRLAIPKMIATIDSINGISLTQTAQLQALNNASLQASVRDTTSTLNPAFSGTAQLEVFDADKTVRFYDPVYEQTFTYKTDGYVIFRGEARVDSGKVKTEFIVPKDISYTNDYGCVRMYFSNASVDGGGYTTNVRIGGADTTAENDNEGPAIRLYLDHRTFRSGDIVSANPMVIADLDDEHGINTSGGGVGHRIEAWLDNNPEGIDLTEYYKSKLDTYKQGELVYPLGELSPGTHTIRLRAWDTYNNSSQSETVFDVVNSVGLRLTSVFNYPNPFSSTTVFSLEHNQLGSVDAEVKIYTVAGRLIQTVEAKNVNNQIINISWDGRDRDGDVIANGVYLYKAIVKTTDNRLTGEAYGKLSVVK